MALLDTYARGKKTTFITKSVYKLFENIVKVGDWLCFCIFGPICHFTLFLLKLSPSTPTLLIFPSLLACLPFSVQTVLHLVLCHINSITLRSPTTRGPCRAVCTFPLDSIIPTLTTQPYQCRVCPQNPACLLQTFEDLQREPTSSMEGSFLCSESTPPPPELGPFVNSVLTSIE